MIRVLYFLPAVPFPPHRGICQRTDLLYRSLARLGHVDTVLLQDPFSPPPDETAMTRLRNEYGLLAVFRIPARGEIGPWCFLRGLSRRWGDTAAKALGDPDVEHQPILEIQTWLEGYLRDSRDCDLIVGRYLPVLARTGALVQSSVPVALDVDDLPTEMCRSRLRTTRAHGLPRLLEQRRLRRLEKSLPSYFASCRVLWVANEEHLTEPGLDRATVLPNIPYFPDGLPEPCAPSPDSKSLLFVGTFSHSANVNGLEVFLQEVWPTVLAEARDARLMLVGSNMSAQQRQYYRRFPNVDPIGFLEDLREAYASSAFSIVPVYEGSGTNIKVAESLAYGRTAVITGFAHRGYRTILEREKSLWVADDHIQFALGCRHLLERPERACAMAQLGKMAVDQHLSYAGLVKTIGDRVMQALYQDGDSI